MNVRNPERSRVYASIAWDTLIPQPAYPISHSGLQPRISCEAIECLF